MVFSTKVESWILMRCADSVIHSKVLLFGFIMIYGINDLFYGFLSVTA